MRNAYKILVVKETVHKENLAQSIRCW